MLLLVPKSILLIQIIGSIFKNSAYASCLSKSKKSGFGDFKEITNTIPC